MPFSDAFLDEVRARVRVSDVVGKRVVLKKKGSEHVGLSPFGEEKTPSFTCADQKGFWHDFSSGKHGDIFAFVMETEGVEFPEAVERIARDFGISVPDDGAPARGRPQAPAARAKANGRHDESEPPFDERGPGVDRAGDREGDRPQDHGRPSKREITKSYDYQDAQGSLNYQTARIEWTEDGKRKKTFLQRRPDGEGHWIWGLSGGEFLRGRDGDWYKATEDRIEKWVGAERRTFPEGVKHGLYRLVEFRELVSPGATVYVPEGEKDTDTFCDWGEIATTNSGGASNWRADHAEMFRGLHVVIPVDNDDAGRKRGDVVAKSLQRVAASVRILDFAAVWPEAPKGADVTDWRDNAGGTAARLHAIVAELPIWQPPPFVSQFEGIPFERLDEPGPEHEYLIDGWLTLGDKSIIGGATKSGKSFLAIEAGGCVATGKDFFGAKVMAPGLVIYQAGEGRRGIKKRFRAWRQYNAILPRERVPIFILQSKIDIYRPDGDTARLIEEINGIRSLYDVPLRALFIDTLAKAQGAADENSGKDMSAVMGNVDKLADAFPGCHVCLVHHFNAAGTKLRGHSSIYANLDQVVLVTKDEASKVRTAVLDKQKDDEDGMKIDFELLVLEVGRRAVDDKPITSCVTVPVGERLALKLGGRAFDRTLNLSDQQTIVYRALVAALVEFGEPTPATLRLPQSIARVVHYKRWHEQYRMVASDDNEGTIRQAMKRTGEHLMRLRVIGRNQPYVWLTNRAVSGVEPIESPGAPAQDGPQDLLDDR